MKLNWGKSLVVFFGIFFAFAAAFIVFAFSHDNDLVVDDYYEQGANYTETIKLKARSLEYADSINVYVDGKAIIATTNSQAIINSDSMKIHFYCGSNRKNDKFFNISKSSDSLVFNKNLFAPTAYTISINWYKDSIQFLIEKPIQIK